MPFSASVRRARPLPPATPSLFSHYSFPQIDEEDINEKPPEFPQYRAYSVSLDRPARPLAKLPIPATPYYALDRVLDVSIEMEPADWDRLRTQTRTLVDIFGGADCLDSPPDDVFTWFEATVTVDGETLAQVGVRKKGFLGSLSKVKPSLKVRFDKFTDGQLLGGAMKRLTLNNAQQDPSMINTCMAYHIFAAAGLPAPRCNFATVAVNGENLGLYVHVESMKTAFLERNFADPSGNFYEGTVSDFRPEWRGTFQRENQ